MKKFIRVTLVTDEMFISYPEMEYKRIDKRAEGNIYLGIEIENGATYFIPHSLIKEIKTWTEE
jgi:hypothetical protein